MQPTTIAKKRKERESTREKLKGNRAGSSLWLVSLAPMSSESESGALRSQKPPLGPSWCPAGPETEGPAHSEDRERAEAREPRALTDCLPGHSPDRASCKTVSTNPEQSEGATWSLALRRHSRPVIPPLLLPFLQSSWSSNSPGPPAAHTTHCGYYQGDSTHPPPASGTWSFPEVEKSTAWVSATKRPQI